MLTFELFQFLDNISSAACQTKVKDCCSQMEMCFLFHAMGLENQSGYVGSPSYCQERALFIWALRRILGRERLIAWGFPVDVGVLEGCWISDAAVLLLYRG